MKDEKAINKLMKGNLPQFSDEKDWEAIIFELKLILARVWSHKEALDITDFMTHPNYHNSPSEDMEIRADNLIHYALTTSAKKDSYRMLNYRFYQQAIETQFHA